MKPGSNLDSPRYRLKNSIRSAGPVRKSTEQIAGQTFLLIRNAKGVVVAADNRKPQSFVKSGSHRASRKLSVPCRENLQISYGRPPVLPQSSSPAGSVPPSCHYNQRVERSSPLLLPAENPLTTATRSLDPIPLFVPVPVRPGFRLRPRPTRSRDTGFRAPNLYAI